MKSRSREILTLLPSTHKPIIHMVKLLKYAEPNLQLSLMSAVNLGGKRSFNLLKNLTTHTTSKSSLKSIRTSY